MEPEDRLVSFDVVSLFTKVPIKEALEHIAETFSPDITNLFRHCLTTSYFQWNGNFYQQDDGVAMGSPLSPVIANFFMEKFEQTALETAPLKPKVWLRYVDDTFVIWNHGEEELQRFLQHLNKVNLSIQFTMEVESKQKLAFLDVLVERTAELNLGHTVYRKPTHTERHLQKTSNHHPRQNCGVIKTLVDRAKRICEPQHLNEEINHLNLTLRANGYSQKDIQRALHPRRSSIKEKEHESPVAKAFLPYIEKTTDRIGRLLESHGIKTIHRPTKKIKEMLRSAKDKRHPHSSAGVYEIPCSCGQVYIGTTKRSIATRLKEHSRLGQTGKSSLVEHSLLPGHDIHYSDTNVLSTTVSYYPRLQREAIEILKHTNSFNRKEESERVDKAWFPELKSLKPGGRSTKSKTQAY